MFLNVTKEQYDAHPMGTEVVMDVLGEQRTLSVLERQETYAENARIVYTIRLGKVIRNK